MHRIACVTASFVLLSAHPQSGEDILRRVEQQLAPIEDYVVDLTAELSMERIRVPRMKATMYFKKPDNIQFESEGFAMLPREGIAVNPVWLRERFTATVVGIDTIGGVRAYKLQLAAKEAAVRLRQLFLWVHAERWTVEKLETIPYQGRSLTVLFHYAQQGGRYWLPDTMTATLGFAAADTSATPFPNQYAPQMNELQRPSRSGTVTVVYSNYRINVGLKDEIFRRNE